VSSGPTITHAQAAKLREVFKGEQGWAIVVRPLVGGDVERVLVQVIRNTITSLMLFEAGADTTEKAVDQLLADAALAFPQIPGVPR
jgi:hypothetical protein